MNKETKQPYGAVGIMLHTQVTLFKKEQPSLKHHQRGQVSILIHNTATFAMIALFPKMQRITTPSLLKSKVL